MKIYHKVLEQQGLNITDCVKDNTIYLYADVNCQDCGKTYSLAFVNGIGGKCPRCGGVCY